MRAVPTNRYVVFASLALIGCAIDLLTKNWIFGRLGMPYQQPTWWLIDDIFGFTTSLNEGALFGIGQKKVWLFATLSIVAGFGIVYWLFWIGVAKDWLLTIALGCVMAGILGNLYDRLGLPGQTWNFGALTGQPVYAVRDWLHFKVEGIIDWPIFNIADSFLVVGAALLVWHTITTPNSSEPGKTA